MKLRGGSWRQHRERLRREEGDIPLAPSGRPYYQVRCVRCGKLLHLVERLPKPEDPVRISRCPRCTLDNEHR